MNKTDIKGLDDIENGPASKRVIELRSVFKTGKTTVQPVPDGMGWYLGIPRLSEDEKRKLTYWAEPDSKFVLKHGTQFNLADEAQKVTWDWVKYSPAIARDQNACQQTPGAEFFIYEDSIEFGKSIERKELKLKAGTFVVNDSVNNHLLRALLLGTDMSGSSPRAVKDYLLELAEQTPEKIIEVYESADLSTKLLLYKALKHGTIVRDDNGLYRYGNITLGVHELGAIGWLRNPENKELVDLLEREVNPEYFERKPKPTDDILLNKSQKLTDTGETDPKDPDAED